MPVYTQDFDLSARADWQRLVRARSQVDTTIIPFSDAAMEIRNSNKQLVVRLDTSNGRIYIQPDGSALLHLTQTDTSSLFNTGFVGTYQAVGLFGIGRAFPYDLFVVWAATGLRDKLLRGFINVDPAVTMA